MLIKIFPTTSKANFLWKFQLRFNLIFNDEIVQYSRTSHDMSKHHETKPVHPFSLRALQRDQECNLKHPCSVDLISSNKTNKLPPFIDRLVYVSYSKYYDLFPMWDMQLYANFFWLLELIVMNQQLIYALIFWIFSLKMGCILDKALAKPIIT